MKNFIFLFLISGSLYGMENGEIANMTPYEKMKLEVKKEKIAIMKDMLAVQKRKTRIKELDFLSQTMGQTIASNVAEVTLMHQMFMNVAINDIFFENLEQSSESLKERMNKSIETYKKILAEKRGVSVENVFDENVQEEAEYKEFANIYEKSQEAAKRILKVQKSKNRDE